MDSLTCRPFAIPHGSADRKLKTPAMNSAVIFLRQAVVLGQMMSSFIMLRHGRVIVQALYLEAHNVASPRSRRARQFHVIPVGSKRTSLYAIRSSCSSSKPCSTCRRTAACRPLEKLTSSKNYPVDAWDAAGSAELQTTAVINSFRSFRLY